jgi:CheY-like chemotaxis protein
VSFTSQGNPPALRVLCIEDDTESLSLIEATVSLRPRVELLIATDGAEGTELARRHHPDLVLTDVDLSGMGGEEVLARLRVDPVTRPVPVVVLSGDPSAAAIDRLMARGAQSCLTKPLNAGELGQALDDGIAGLPAGDLPRAA